MSKLLSTPYQGLSFSDIAMNDDEVFAIICLPGQDPPMTNKKLQTIPRLIGRILAYNICPKTGSYNYYSRDLATCVYVNMANLEVKLGMCHV